MVYEHGSESQRPFLDEMVDFPLAADDPYLAAQQYDGQGQTALSLDGKTGTSADIAHPPLRGKENS